MVIENKKKIPPVSLSQYVMFLAGDKKIGKTSFCAQFPDHFIFEFECGNAKHLEAVYEDIADLKTFEKFLAEVRQTDWIKTVVLDEITVLYEMIMRKVCEEEAVRDLTELSYGRGWSRVRLQFADYLREIHNLGCGVIYTAHTEVKTYKTRQREVSKLEANLAKQVGKDMDRLTHIWGVMQFDEEHRRMLYIEGDDYIKAGHGFANHFKFVDNGKLYLGKSPVEAYNNFLQAWNNIPIKMEDDEVEVEEEEEVEEEV